jgi:hypothetical protein
MDAPVCCFQQHVRVRVWSSPFFNVAGDDIAYMSPAVLSDTIFSASLVFSAGFPPL